MKRALLNSSLEKGRSELGWIKESTRGVVFFAIQHKGFSSVGAVKFALGGVMGKKEEREMLPNEIEILDEEFTPQMADYRILTFFETKLTKVKTKIFGSFPFSTRVVCTPLILKPQTSNLKRNDISPADEIK